jgi:hypothetical protein
MQDSNSDYAVFYATFKSATASSWLLQDISLTAGQRDVQIKSAYFPKSQLEYTLHNEKTKVIRCVVPEWLWTSKVIEADKWSPNSHSEFDQFEKMYATEETRITKA